MPWENPQNSAISLATASHAQLKRKLSGGGLAGRQGGRDICHSRRNEPPPLQDQPYAPDPDGRSAR